MAEVTDFLDQVINQDFSGAAPTFADIMGDRISDSLEQEKVKIANSVYNGVDPEERESQDQYELDLEDPEIDEDELDAAAAEALDADEEYYEEDESEPEEDDSEQ